MFSEPPPPILSWGDILLSVVAFLVGIVTLPTAFQMWFGRPSINVEFGTDRMDAGTSLKCYMYNDSIKKKWLKFLGVRREPAHDVAAVVAIKDHPKGKVLARARLRMNVEKGQSLVRADIHAGGPATSVILYHQKGEIGARLKDHDESIEDQLIGPGEYETELEIVWGQERLVKKQLLFIGQNDERTHWEI